jgi:hypothetical protein
LKNASGHVEEITSCCEIRQLLMKTTRAFRMPLTKPDNNKFNTESVSGLLAVVLDDLRRKDDHPAGN